MKVQLNYVCRFPAECDAKAGYIDRNTKDPLQLLRRMGDRPGDDEEVGGSLYRPSSRRPKKWTTCARSWWMIQTPRNNW